MNNANEKFLPMSKGEMKKLGWEQCDFVYLIGDAYVDHPSFGPAIISRHLSAYGYRVGIISQHQKTGKEQYMLPYLMSSHPGSTLQDAVELAEYVRDLGYMPEQVQDFYPTPSTISTCMYYTGLDPRTMKPIYVPKNPHEKALQRALIQYRKPENYELVKEALYKAHREDLIGFDKHCLIPPRKFKKNEKKH